MRIHTKLEEETQEEWKSVEKNMLCGWLMEVKVARKEGLLYAVLLRAEERFVDEDGTGMVTRSWLRFMQKKHAGKEEECEMNQ